MSEGSVRSGSDGGAKEDVAVVDVVVVEQGWEVVVDSLSVVSVHSVVLFDSVVGVNGTGTKKWFRVR